MNDWVTPGYEHLELSTQRVIAAALEKDIQVEILDVPNQWIRLSKDGHEEIIRQSNETSADSYITSLILGDKSMQKMLLAEAEVNMPQGRKYNTLEAALTDFSKYKTGRWVVKPTTANYGLGISVLSENVEKSDFEIALKLAFKHDKTILVEAFAPGIECRFLVIGGTTRAVLHRVPAHVVGDGKSSIKQLVEAKNKDPRRGENYKTPLEKIKIGEVEIALLAASSFTPDSVLTEGETAWLRQNSNISTGGDSLDYTDLVHPSYSAIAEKACATVGAQICGVDMMLPDHTAPADTKNYNIIELNYNPVLYFHDFPYEGKNRNVAPHVLEVLGF